MVARAIDVAPALTIDNFLSTVEVFISRNFPQNKQTNKCSDCPLKEKISN
jgi:hypothetical protein